MRGTLHLVSRTDYVRFRRTLQPMLTAGLRSHPARPDGGARCRGCARRGPRVVRPGAADVRRAADAPRGALSGRRRARARLRGAHGAAAAAGAGRRRAVGVSRARRVCRCRVVAWRPRLRQATPPRRSCCGILRRSVRPRPPTRRRGADWHWARCSSGCARSCARSRTSAGASSSICPMLLVPTPMSEAPVRFLPEWDNLLLSHADRSRVIADAHRPAIATANLRLPGRSSWTGSSPGCGWPRGRRRSATLELRPFCQLTRSDADSARRGRRVAVAVSRTGRDHVFGDPDRSRLSVRFIAHPRWSRRPGREPASSPSTFTVVPSARAAQPSLNRVSSSVNTVRPPTVNVSGGARARQVGHRAVRATRAPGARPPVPRERWHRPTAIAPARAGAVVALDLVDHLTRAGSADRVIRIQLSVSKPRSRCTRLVSAP